MTMTMFRVQKFIRAIEALEREYDLSLCSSDEIAVQDRTDGDVLAAAVTTPHGWLIYYTTDDGVIIG